MVNKVFLIGFTGQIPDTHQFEDGSSVASFSLATTESYKNKAGEKVEQTEWHNIKCYRHLAELAEKYIGKGKQLYIEGKITTRSWEDKEGEKRYTTEIIASKIQLLGRKDDTEEGQDDRYSRRNQETEDNEPGDQLPF